MQKRTNYKGKKRVPNKFDKEKTSPDSAVSKEKFNDPAWYVSREQLAKDVASLSFNNALGSPVDIDFNRDEYTSVTSYRLDVPGIMSIFTVPTMGYSTDGSSPINIAAKNIYSWVRHQNSGHANYEAADLMLYLGAMDSVYSVIAYMMRIYGVARVFSQTNRYVGDALIHSQGMSPIEVRANLANFRSFINMTITKASAFCTPNIMSLYRRHFWMYSGIYKDEDISKSQMYMYRPGLIWRYVETDGVGRLRTIPFTAFLDGANGVRPQVISFSTLQAIVNDMLSALTSSEDINIMSGDILKAYGRENLWVLGLINEDYATLPVYSEEVLSQIHNTTFIGNIPTHNVVPSSSTFAPTLEAFDVFQDPQIGEGAIQCTPQVVDSKHLGYARLLDFDKEDPTPEDVLVATRNMVMGTPFIYGSGDAARVMTNVNTFASDLALFAYVYTLVNGTYLSAMIGDRDQPYGISTSVMMSRFKGAPILPIMSSANAASYLTGLMGALGNYTVLDWNDLSKMHESAILAMLGVPFYGVAK